MKPGSTMILLLMLLASRCVLAQEYPAKKVTKKPAYAGFAFTNSQTAMPFGKFAGLFSEAFHPGMEIRYGKTLYAGEKHDWFSELRMGYFFHRFVQHSFPLTINGGYRFYYCKKLSAQTSLGAGYMHSIPATAVLKANENGNYENNKGIGRAQATVTWDIGAGYLINPKDEKPCRVFFSYQQRLQLPFVRSYVPLLPYNSIALGITKSIR